MSPKPPTPPTTLRLAVSQSHTLSSTPSTLAALTQTALRASHSAIDVLLFPEAYLGGYPRGATFGAAVGARDDRGREQYLHYFKDSVDLGDSPVGEGERWVRRERAGVGTEVTKVVMRGDGIREELERVSRETGVFLVVGLVERAGGTLYCAVVYVCPKLGVIGKRRKVMPTGTERLIWGQGQPSSLRAVTTTIRGVKLTLAAAICWENYMPLLRHSLYSQNVNLYLAPTADAKDTWLSLMRTIACEGRCFVLSANQCIKRENLPKWVYVEKKKEQVTEDDEPSSRRLRRKSVAIENGHEIALPGEDGEDPIEQVVTSGEEKKDDMEGVAGSSTTKEGGHRISSPTDNSKESSARIVGSSEDMVGSKERGRKASFVTEHGHEIVFPTESGRVKIGKNFHSHSSNETEASQNNGIVSEFACRGGSCIISPTGDVLAGPVWEKEDELLIVDVDFDDCLRGRLDLDVAGSYSRNDAFKLTVEGLDLSPPP